MPLRFEGELRLQVDGKEAFVRGRGDKIHVDGSLLRVKGFGPKVELGPMARMADKMGVTLCLALPGGFEMRLGREASHSGWVSRLVNGPASVGRSA